MIRLDHVNKTYPTRDGSRVILNDISFELGRGKNWASWS
jgi:ABC-type ATPase involved in cell division